MCFLCIPCVYGPFILSKDTEKKLKRVITVHMLPLKLEDLMKVVSVYKKTISNILLTINRIHGYKKPTHKVLTVVL